MSEVSDLPQDPPSDPPSDSPKEEQPPAPDPDPECDEHAPEDPFHSVLTTGLLHLFGEGNDAALGHFMAVEGKHLRRYIDRRLPVHVRGPIGIDDILQDVMIILTDKRDKGELEVINTKAFRGLVRKITQGVISRAVAAAHAQKRDIARKAPQAGTDENGSTQGDLIDQVPARTDSPSKMVHREEQVDALKLSLAAMTQDEIEIIDMRKRRNLEYIEIGELLKISEGSARKRFHRAITHLQELLRKEYPESI